MISVRFDPDRNALYVSGVMTPFPAGSLEARRLGDMLAVANPHEDALVCAWVRFDGWTVDGTSGFASVEQAFAALTDACNRKRPLAAEFVQSAPALAWRIPHGLAFRPNVAVIDSAGDLCLADVAWPDAATVIVTFGAPTSGTAYLS